MRPPPPAARRIRPLRRMLDGAHPALPRPLDVTAERWARLPPRLRALVAVALVLAVGASSSARVRAAEGRWGGDPVSVLVAAEDLAIGADLSRLRTVRLPPDALPARPLAVVPIGAVLAMALPEGAVLTESHVAPSGPAAGLPDDLRALPIPVEESWGVTAGGWVDVWVLGGVGGDGEATAAARSRPVLELRGEGGDATALVGLGVDEVTAVTGALGQGRVLLAHAPPPDPPAD